MPAKSPDHTAAIERAQCLAVLATALGRAESQLRALGPGLDPAELARLGSQIAAARRELDWLRRDRAAPVAEETSPFWRKLLPPD